MRLRVTGLTAVRLADAAGEPLRESSAGAYLRMEFDRIARDAPVGAVCWLCGRRRDAGAENWFQARPIREDATPSAFAIDVCSTDADALIVTHVETIWREMEGVDR